MSEKGDQVAQCAISKCKGGGPSGKGNCWDGAFLCLREGKVTNLNPDRDGATRFIKEGDKRARSAADMRSVAKGAVIGFFAPPLAGTGGNILAHAMISVGSGDAAGCNNGCLELGATVSPGWQIIKLADRLNWQNGCHRASSGSGHRDFEVYYRTV